MAGGLDGTSEPSTGPSGLGAGNWKSGLAGVPLPQSTENNFAARSETGVRWLISRLLDGDLDLPSLLAELNTVARELGSEGTGGGVIPALLFKLPQGRDAVLPNAYAEHGRNGFDPNEPRDWHGRWTTGGGSGGESRRESGSAGEADDERGGDTRDPVRLPPGERIDELGDLLEWIANARPEEEAELRAEIKRYFYDVGDTTGGNALNAALSEVVYDKPTRQDREKILEGIGHYAASDPADVAGFRRDLVGQSLLGAAYRPWARNEAAIARGAERSPAWKLGWGARGDFIDDVLGRNLSRGYPGIDHFPLPGPGVATSHKSIDLMARTYRTPDVYCGVLMVMSTMSPSSMGQIEQIVPSCPRKLRVEHCAWQFH
jgi:hypothetical protein